jgi:phosphate transport system substrate-binding protein
MKKSLLYISVLFLASCGQSGPELDTPTSGVISISADDAYRPIVDAEITVYEALYPRAKIHAHYESEDSAFKDLLADSARLIVVNRKLTTQEENYFKNKQLFPEQVKIATDALALIVNNNAPDTLLTLDRVKAIFSGQDSTWKAIVFDHENSGNARYIQDSILHGKPLPKNCFAVHGNPQVVDYVSKNKSALGIIGVNWISNAYDSTVIRFLKQVKVIAISYTDSKDPNTYHQPYQAYMKMGDYPLCRDMYIISREARTGLGSGFLSFVTADKGQRIIYREGLLPATVPTHIIRY